MRYEGIKDSKEWQKLTGYVIVDPLGGFTYARAGIEKNYQPPNFESFNNEGKGRKREGKRKKGERKERKNREKERI